MHPIRSRKPVKPKKISLSEWICEKGVDYVAKLLEVQESTVRHWRNGTCLPRTDQMRFIKNFTKGRVGYDEIIDGKTFHRGQEVHQ